MEKTDNLKLMRMWRVMADLEHEMLKMNLKGQAAKDLLECIYQVEELKHNLGNLTEL